jgi:hypothetical protein
MKHLSCCSGSARNKKAALRVLGVGMQMSGIVMAYANLDVSPLRLGRRDDFCILRRKGHWSIFSGGSYFGQYVSAERAMPLAIRVAQDAARAGLAARVLLIDEDGGACVLWQTDQVNSLADITRS